LILWSNLFSIIDIQINKKDKIIIIKFFNDSKNLVEERKIKIDNILLFKEALIKRMSHLKIKVESEKIIKGKPLEKRFIDKDINNMHIDELVSNFHHFLDLLKNNIISFYNVTTFFNITKKIVEYYSARNDQSHMFYLNEMKSILDNEEIKRILVNS